jgi:hypothetical protein
MRFKIECGIEQNSKKFNRWISRAIDKFNRRNKIVVRQSVEVIEINVNDWRIEIEVIVRKIINLVFCGCKASLWALK